MVPWNISLKVQTQRRPTDDWVRYQLINELDSLMERGGDRRSEQAKSKGSQEPIETRHSTSAERTAALVGCSATTVKRARRIRKEGTPSMLEALKNREMTISQVEKAIVEKAKAKEGTGEESSVGESKNSMVHLTDENLAVLEQLDGTLHHHVNKAVSWYIRLAPQTGDASQRKSNPMVSWMTRIPDTNIISGTAGPRKSQRQRAALHIGG